MSCPTTVHEDVCVQAVVKISPEVTTGDVMTFCAGNPFMGTCPGTPARFCSFIVSQRLCVQVPITFHAAAEVTPAGIVCGTSGIGGCPTLQCTHTIGYFKNHPEETNALITAASGSIILGINGDGLSYAVTTLNANDVLDFNTESPPAPSDPPYAAQYQVLYAQLLGANLNVLNGAVCDFAANAIANANTFLANSPLGGMGGAPAFQAPLALFNQGNAPGCPFHCDD